MSKIQLTKFVANCLDTVKQFSFAEKIIRRNPVYYAKAEHLFSTLKTASFISRKQIIEELLANSLKNGTVHLKEFEAENKGVSALPFINKLTIQENPKNYLGRLSKLSIPSGTGGSTGVPLRLYRSFPSIVVEQAAIDSVYKQNDVNPLQAKIAVLRGDSIKVSTESNPEFWEYNANNRILKLSSHHMTTDTINVYLDELERFNPDVISAYPSAIEFFSHLVEQSGREFKIPLVVTSSEVFTSQSRDKVSDVLGCVTCDYYGQAERVAFAYSNKVNEYYFLPGYSYIELAYKYSEDEFDYYEVIGTSLWNKAMSIQRYSTGDLAVLPTGLTDIEIDEICCGVKPFYGILGRTSEYLLSPEGQHLIGINQIPKFINNVVQMQFVQDSLNCVDILIIASPGFSEVDRREINVNARKKIPNTIEINIKVVNKLNKTKSFKTPLVIRNCSF